MICYTLNLYLKHTIQLKYKTYVQYNIIRPIHLHLLGQFYK